MSNNEITVKVKCRLDELCQILEEKNFKVVDKFSLDDTYYIPGSLDISNMSPRKILSSAVIIRHITEKKPYKEKVKITFKKKEFDEEGNILKQDAVNCQVLSEDDAKKLIEAIGYRKIVNIKEDDIVYGKDGFELAIKDIINGDNLIEVETDEKDPMIDTIEKLKKKIVEINIPIYTDNYFVKKAEIELEKVLKN